MNKIRHDLTMDLNEFRIRKRVSEYPYISLPVLWEIRVRTAGTLRPMLVAVRGKIDE